ncbi:MAG: PepSY domain-containing protein [Methylococcaceae bacterium]|nr:PepSY domain-containing protein [Methylococcaceae bacterium]
MSLEPASSQAIERRWLGWHRLLGLTGGLLLVVAAFSGSLSLIWQAPVPPKQIAVQSDAHPARTSLDRLFASVQAAHPRRYGPWLLELPLDDSKELGAWYLQPEETEDRGYAPLRVSVDINSGHIVSTRIWDDGGVGAVLKLHRRLGWDGPAASVTAAIMTLVLAASGLSLWRTGRNHFPLSAGDGGWTGRSRLWHRRLGLFATPALLMAALTGIALNLPERWTIPPDTDLHPGGLVRSTSDPGSRPLGIEEAVAVARGLFPHAVLRRIALPAGEIGVYRVELCQRIEADCRHPATSVWVDRYSGQIRGVDNPGQWPRVRRLVHDLSAWHSGLAFGTVGRLYWCLAGFVPLVLAVSGGWSWAVRRGWVEDRPADWGGTFNRLHDGLGLDHAKIRTFAADLRLAVTRLRELADRLQRKYFQ